MMERYDALDISILTELRKNCKRPMSALAMELGISPTTLIERIKRLEKEGVINGYQAHINYSKLGFGTHAFVSVQLREVGNKNAFKEIIALPEVAAFYWIAGLFDCFGIVRTTDRAALSEVLKRFAENKLIIKTKTDVVFETYKNHYEFNPFYQEKISYYANKVKKIEHSKHTYDNLDLALVRELRGNAKVSYRELAKKLKTHQNTLMHRIKRLEESGVIVKYVADIDYYKLGYSIGVITMMRLRGTEIPDEATVCSISVLPEVKAFYGITGNYDAVALIRAKTADDLTRVLQSAYWKSVAVRRTVTSLILYTYKDLCEYNPYLNAPLLEHEL